MECLEKDKEQLLAFYDFPAARNTARVAHKSLLGNGRAFLSVQIISVVREQSRSALFSLPS